MNVIVVFNNGAQVADKLTSHGEELTPAQVARFVAYHHGYGVSDIYRLTIDGKETPIR